MMHAFLSNKVLRMPRWVHLIAILLVLTLIGLSVLDHQTPHERIVVSLPTSAANSAGKGGEPSKDVDGAAKIGEVPKTIYLSEPESCFLAAANIILALGAYYAAFYAGSSFIEAANSTEIREEAARKRADKEKADRQAWEEARDTADRAEREKRDAAQLVRDNADRLEREKRDAAQLARETADRVEREKRDAAQLAREIEEKGHYQARLALDKRVRALELSQYFSCNHMLDCRKTLRTKYEKAVAKYKAQQLEKAVCVQKACREMSDELVKIEQHGVADDDELAYLRATSSLLDFFEDVYFAIKHELADKAILKESLVGAHGWCLTTFISYVELMRDRDDDPEFYCGFTKLTADFA